MTINWLPFNVGTRCLQCVEQARLSPRPTAPPRPLRGKPPARAVFSRYLSQRWYPTPGGTHRPSGRCQLPAARGSLLPVRLTGRCGPAGRAGPNVWEGARLKEPPQAQPAVPARLRGAAPQRLGRHRSQMAAPGGGGGAGRSAPSAARCSAAREEGGARRKEPGAWKEPSAGGSMGGG